ncbi:hypothetical protein Q7P37_007762 [Cladosporium fusiforme]
MAPTRSDIREQVSQMTTEAAITDDPDLIAKCIELASQLPTDLAGLTLYKGLKRAIHNGAIKVLSYLLDHGADFSRVDGCTVTSQPDELSYKLPSLEVLECLLARGWDINAGTPLLWCVTCDIFWINWCLDHGATVEERMESNGTYRGAVLEKPATGGNIATLELLRARGAPVSRGVLPCAVRSASYHAPKDDSELPSERYKKQLKMITHLIDVVGIDVNQMSWGVGAGMPSGSWCSTPLCCAAYAHKNETPELVWLLLDRGGDPDLAFTYPNEDGTLYNIPSALEAHSDNEPFKKAVEDWRRQHRGNVD